MRSPRVVDAVLSLIWIAAAAVAGAALLMLGYVGYLMILVWGALALPLSVVTTRRLRSTGRDLDPSCRALAMRSYTILAATTVFVHTALISGLLASEAPLGSDALGMLASVGFWILFAGEIGYVLAATYWLVRTLARARPLNDSSRQTV
jgi:hypothetical protein